MRANSCWQAWVVVGIFGVIAIAGIVLPACWVAARLDVFNHGDFCPRVFRPDGLSLPDHAAEFPPILSGFAHDGYHWIRYAQTMEKDRLWRVRHTDMDCPPTGRTVNWSSLFTGWLWMLGKITSLFTADPCNRAIARTSWWANPLLHVIVLVLAMLIATRSRGPWAGVFIAIGMVSSTPFTEGFQAANPDHHGLVDGVILLVFLLTWCCDFGFIETPGATASATPLAEDAVCEQRERARRYFLTAGVVTGLGVAISALPILFVLAGLGLGTLLACALFPRKGLDAPMIYESGVWQAWGRAAGGTALVLYLLEYFPGPMRLLLDVNHPLWALALWGSGELMTVTTSGLAGRGRPTISLYSAAAIFVAVSAPLVLIAFGPAGTFSIGEPFLGKIGDQIVELRPLSVLIDERGTNVLLHMFHLQPAAILIAVGIIVWGLGSPVQRAGLVVLIVPVLLLGWQTWEQGRWALQFSAAVQPLVVAVIGVLVSLAHGLSCSNARQAALTAIALFFAGVQFLAAPRHALEVLRKEGLRPMPDLSESIDLAVRDLVGFLKVRRPEVTPVFFSGTALGTSLAYFSGGRALATLFWENREGLRAAGAIACAQTDEEAYQLLRERQITHLVFSSKDLWNRYYYPIFRPGSPPGEETTSFWHRVFRNGQLPRWLRPVVYELPPYFRDAGFVMGIYEFYPQQTEAEALHHMAGALARQGRFALAVDRWQESLRLEPQRWESRLALGLTWLEPELRVPLDRAVEEIERAVVDCPSLRRQSVLKQVEAQLLRSGLDAEARRLRARFGGDTAPGRGGTYQDRQ